MSTRTETLLLGEHSMALTTALHLVPGVLITAAYVWIGLPVAEAVGYPSLFGFLIAAVIVLVPWELGLPLYLGRRRNGKWSFDGVVLFRNRLPPSRLLAIVAVLCVWALAVAIGLSIIDGFLFERFFSWVPQRLQLQGFDPTDYSIAVFNVATVLNLLFFGVAAPLVEEIYFRGFLLPRMPGGRSAPMANSVLFVVYHFWTPWKAVTRILFVVPMVWMVWRKQAIEVGIWTHCTLNCLGILLTYALLMSTV